MGKVKTDQYGNKLPDDLGLLRNTPPTISKYTDSDLAIVFAANWYECNGTLLASARETDYIVYSIESWPYDDDAEVFRVAAALKRYNPEDGFYHA